MPEEMTYHVHGCQPHKLVVVKKHSNGTVDLHDGQRIVVAGCPVGPQSNSHHGYAVAVVPELKRKPVDPESLDKSTVDDLLAFADEKSIVIEPGSKKADIIAAIQLALIESENPVSP